MTFVLATSGLRISNGIFTVRLRSPGSWRKKIHNSSTGAARESGEGSLNAEMSPLSDKIGVRETAGRPETEATRESGFFAEKPLFSDFSK